MNLGGWLSQSSLETSHLRDFVTEGDFRRLAAWGFTTARLPFNADLVEGPNFTLKPHGLEYLERAVAMAEAHRLQLILDLHEAPGVSFVDMDRNGLYTDPLLRKRLLSLWHNLARHFRKAGDWLLFEGLNEPVAPTHEAWQSLADDITKAIREADPRRPIVLGSNLWSVAHTFPYFRPTGDDRTLYTFHCYEPVHFTHQGAPWVDFLSRLPLPQRWPGEMDAPAGSLDNPMAQKLAPHLAGHWDAARLEQVLQPMLDWKKAHKAQVFCGEFGVYLKAPRQDQVKWMDDFMGILEKHQLGFTYWTLRDMDFGLEYPGDRFKDLPQYQNEAKRDEALLQRMRQASALLVERW
jgi:endoglucanase